MKTAIVTDSAAYLDSQVAADHNITVVPITVIFGQQTLFGKYRYHEWSILR